MGVVEQLLTLYPGVQGSMPRSSSLLDETKLWPHIHMTLAVGGMLNENCHVIIMKYM